MSALRRRLVAAAFGCFAFMLAAILLEMWTTAGLALGCGLACFALSEEQRR